MAAIVDLPDLRLMPAVAAAIVDRIFLEDRPLVGEGLLLENCNAIVVWLHAAEPRRVLSETAGSEAVSANAIRAMSSMSAIA